MHAVVVDVEITDLEAARRGLEQLVPAVTQAPGFVAAWWLSFDDGTGTSIAVYETEGEARAAVGTTEVAEPPPRNQRGRFYLYCRQNGLWPKEVAAHDPDTEPKAFDPFCPVRNLSDKYPPTLLIHGTKDTDVPHEQSVVMDRELSRHGVPHEFISVPGAGHGLGGVDKTLMSGIYERVMTFLRRYSA